jgi:hypothetical protein
LPPASRSSAATIIARVTARAPKRWRARDEEGEYRDVGYVDEALFDSRSTFVLFRNHYRGRALAKQLEEAKKVTAPSANRASCPW